jgi:hypothetical protein
MASVSQAEFSRLLGVSRKTVTIWKAEGKIVMNGERVDVEASRERLAKFSGAASKVHAALVTGNDEAPRSDVSGLILNLACCAAGFAEDASIAMLPLLPEATVKSIHADLLAHYRRVAVELLDEDNEPPAGCSSWSEHRLFTEPVSVDWSELRAQGGRLI